MGFTIFVIFLALSLSLILFKVKTGKAAEWAKLFRVITVVCSVSVFTYWFVKKSTIGIVKDSVGLQIINKLPQALDFYVVNINNLDKNRTYETRHIGKIRPEYYRIDHLKMDKSDEYWIAGYLGKKNLVYFSQHSVPNKNIDQVIEVQNYINQSIKLSESAKKKVEAYNHENIKLGVWLSLDLLLLFLNLVLLVRRKKHSN